MIKNWPTKKYVFEMSEDLITSEVNTFLCTPSFTTSDSTIVSKLTFTKPFWWCEITQRLLKKQSNKEECSNNSEDSDGDLQVKRKSNTQSDLYLEVEHKLETNLSNVGFQIWLGSFFMADYMIQFNDSEILNKNILEIGAGVGICSIVATLCGAKSILATDLDPLTSVIRSNIDRNLSSCNINVATLDVTSPPEDLVLSDYEVLIGADVVYDDALTDGIVSLLRNFFNSSQQKKRVVLFALEKRYIFTLRELDTVAPAFDYLISRLHDLQKNYNKQLTYSEVQKDVIEQSFCYLRSEDLVLLRIEFDPSAS